jgi:Eco57I restriction-modification methylase
MDKETRNRIQRATQGARTLLEREYAEQLEGIFDIHLDGGIATEPGRHLDADERVRRTKLVVAVEHLCSGGLTAADAVAGYLREAAFTTLNRFVALKMLEARGLVQDCISHAEESAGFKEFAGLAPGLVQLPDRGYRLYIESLFDEVGREVRVLFDRRDPASLLWPRRQTVLDLLSILNAIDLIGVWHMDETIGWVYQYFNSDEERRQMRAASQAPQNSRELAVRNQFFTPRYVVEFLTDNTLGRIWYEMTQGKTRLVDECDYLVRYPAEVFLAESEGKPQDARADEDVPQEELLRTIYIPFRRKKDPRDLKVIDPACGSAHFLIYSFDLLVIIYEEAWADDSSPPSEITGYVLRRDYPSLKELRRALPALILRHNLYGIDIDPRCTQIAALAVWMRAQRAYDEFDVARGERRSIVKTNIVVAEPMPGEKELRQEFISSLDKQLGQLVEHVFDKMELAGEAGSLLRIENEIHSAIREIYGVTGDLFSKSDESRWHQAESELGRALQGYVDRVHNGRAYRRRLFAEDAARGLGFIDACRQRYDVALMNPPFGEFIDVHFMFLDEQYNRSKRDLAIAFIDRGLEMAAIVGGIHSRKSFFLDTQRAWRDHLRVGFHFAPTADLGHRVLDDALVEVAASVVMAGQGSSVFIQCLDTSDKETALRQAVRMIVNDSRVAVWNLAAFECLPSGQFAYAVPRQLLGVYARCESLDPTMALCRDGLSTRDNFRFLRLHWELPSFDPNGPWVRLAKGGEYQPYYLDCELVANWEGGSGQMFAYGDALGNGAVTKKGSVHYFKPALTYTERTASRLSVRILPADTVFSTAGPGIVLLDIEDALPILGILNSYIFAALYEVCVGGGDSVSSGSAARHYTPGGLGSMPFPSRERIRAHNWPTEQLVQQWIALAQERETSPLFVPALPLRTGSIHECAEMVLRNKEEHLRVLWELSRKLELAALDAFGLDESILPRLEPIVGPHPVFYSSTGEPKPQEFTTLFQLTDDALVDEVAAKLGNPRFAVVKSYVADRRYELLAHHFSVHPERIIEIRRRCGAFPPNHLLDVSRRIMSLVVGRVFDRWAYEAFPQPNSMRLLTGGIPAVPEPDASGTAILVDDSGHPDDIVGRIESSVDSTVSSQLLRGALDEVAGSSSTLREHIRHMFFDQHLKDTSLHRRTAPVIWQLATASMRYSVWLYYHRFTKDTFYKVLNDYVMPKLRHEERKLAAQTQGAGGNPTQNLRKEFADQKTLVEELRAFRDEVARIAPLWNPDPNDGVIINFAPLWRLVPYHRAWQRECKDCWERLVAGEYDWAHLAMHLWPERVVPKCADDRSLAIAHGIEEVFWIEGSDGKWQPRKIDPTTIDELIKKRTSAAVKDALKNLLDAPAPTSARGSTRTTNGRRVSRRRATRRDRSLAAGEP